MPVKFIFFVKHSYRDIGRHKCHFCLAFSSVFVVVLSALVMQTVVDQGPMIFVRLQQDYSGEIDFFYTAFIKSPVDKDWWTLNSYDIQDCFLNYTHITEQYGKEFNLAPRA